MSLTLPAGMQINAPIEPGFETVLTPEALAFVADLHRAFEPRRRELLAARVARAQRFDAVQAAGAETVAKAAAAVGARMVQVSAIGADANSAAAYARAKAAGEKAVLAALPQAVIMRPSIVF